MWKSFTIYLIFTILFTHNASSFIIKREKKPQTFKKDVSSDIIKENKMVVFTNSISNTEDVDIAKSGSDVFGANEMSVFSSDNLTANQKTQTINLTKNVRFRTNEAILIYANEAQMNQAQKTMIMQDAHVFLYDNSSGVARTLLKDENDNYEMKNAVFSVCEVLHCEELDAERERSSKNYSEERNILIPYNLNTFKNNKTYEEVEKQYRSVPWSIKADSIKMEKGSNEIVMKNVKFRAFGIPIFMLKEYKHEVDNKGKDGFLNPSLTMLGARQIGLSLPYYIRKSSQTDFIITPTAYTALSPITGKTQKIGNTMDQSRIRENTIGFTFRHLFYEEDENRSQGFIKLNSLITNHTNLINPYTRKYKTDENGSYVAGNRWKIDLEAEFGISKDTYVKGKFLKTSDPNLMPVYEYKYEPYSRNFLGITKVNEDSYNMAEVVSFSPLLTYVSPQTIPTALHVRSVFEKKLDNLFGGRFLLDQRIVDLKRTAGYQSSIYNLNLGYSLPIRTKSDLYIHSNANFLFDSQTSKYNEFSNSNYGKVATYSGISQSYLYNYENSRMQYYGLSLNGQNYHRSRSYYNTSIDISKPIFTGFGRFGQVIVEPRFTFKQSPFTNVSDMVLEDSLGTQIQSANLYASNLSSGYGIVDSGKRMAYGVNLYSKLGISDLSFSAGGGVVTYIGSQNAFLQDYNGFGGRFSNYVGNIKLYNNFFSLEHNYTIQSESPNALFTAITTPYTNSTRLSFNFFDGMRFSANYSKLRTNPFGYSGSLTTFAPSIIYTFKSGLSIGATGVLIATNSNNSQITSSSGWLRKGFSIMKQTNCVVYGVTYFQNTYAVAGVSQSPMIRFNFGITGL